MRQGLRLILICLAAAMPGHLSAADGADHASVKTTDGRSWRIQRLLVPADRPDQWPRDARQRYLPMPAKEFEQRLERLREQDAPLDGAADALTSAEYDAEFADGDLLGRAVWSLRPSNSAATRIVLFRGCRLPIRDPRWLESGETAVVGNDGQGRLAAIVDRNLRLQFQWTLRGRAEDDAQCFTFQPATCPISVLKLTLPADLAPTTDGGVITPDEGAADGRRRWRVELGGVAKVELRIAKQNRSQQAPPTLTRESMTYQLGSQGLELAADYILDVPSEPLRQLTLHLDAPLAPISIAVDGLDRPFVTATDGVDGSTEVTVDLKESLRGAGRTLRVTAIAPLVLDAPWKIPLARVDGSRWQEGSIRLVVPDPLLVSDLRTKDCRQTGVAPLEEQGGEVIEIQPLTPSPEIRVRLAPRRDQIAIRSGVSVAVRPTECAGRFAAVLSSKQGERFALQAEIARHWIIDDVQSEPAELLADWSQEPAASEPGKLKLQLAAALSPAREVRLLITGRRRRGTSIEPLAMEDLRMLRFTDVSHSGRRLVHLQVDDSSQLRIERAQAVERIDPALLSPQDASLLAPNPKGVVLVDDERADRFVVDIDALPTKFEADIRTEVLMHEQQIRESYILDVAPQGSDLQQLTVLFSQPREQQLQWSIDDEDTAELPARRLSAAEQSELGLAEGEAWRITLLPPRSQPFRLKAHRDLPAADEMPVALASIREAAAQRGTVVVMSDGSWSPEVTARRLKGITPAPPANGQYSNIVAMYRYEPADDVLLGIEPPLVLGRSRGSHPPWGAWVWRARLTSRWNTTGLEHVLECEAENAGRGSIEFWLPRGSELRGAWFDDRPAADAIIVGPGPVRFTFPPGSRFGSLVLHWVDETGSPSPLASYAAPWLRCDVPILAREWTVWLPPGLALSDTTMDGRPAFRPSWTSQLFGPLARDRSVGPFNPLSTDHWRLLFDPLLESEDSEAIAQRLAAGLKRAIAEARAGPTRNQITWARLIGQAWTDAGGATAQSPVLLVDRAAMVEAAIRPDLPLHAGTIHAGVIGLADIREELICLAHPRAVVITTRHGAARASWAGRAGNSPDPTSRQSISNDEPFDRIAAAAENRDPDFPSWQSWSAGPRGMTTMWHDEKPMQLAGSSGWTITRFECGASTVAEIVVVDKGVLAAWAWALFVLAAALRWWVGRQPAVVDAALLAAATGGALLMPSVWAPLSAAVWLGLVAGLVATRIDWSAPATRTFAKEEGSAGRSSRWAVTAPIACLLIAIVWQALGFAQEETPPAAPEVHRLLIPVDDRQRPSGDFYYLSEDFREQLLQATEADSAGAPRWLMTRADFRAQLDRDGGGRFAAANWTAEFEIQSLDNRSLIELPLGADGSTVVPDGVKLDGKLAAFRWDDLKQKLLVEIESKGRHTLEVLFRPQTRQGGFDFAVPAVADATVHLSAAGGDAPEFDSSLGTVRRIAADRWQAQLGPAGRVVLRPGGISISSTDSPAVFGVDELYWLRIRPGAVTIDARLRLNVEEGRLQTLRLAADSRLRPMLRPELGTLHVRAVDGNLNRWFLELARPIGGQATIDMSWLIEGAKGAGDLSLPRLETSGARAARRLWALSVDPALVYSETRGAGTRSIAPDQFSALWLSGVAKPDSAIQRQRIQSQWNISTRWRQPKLVARYQLVWTFDRQWADLTAVAAVTTSAAPVFQYRLSVPPEMEIADVSLHERNGERPARWSRSGPDEVTVFLSAPTLGERTVILRGRMPRGEGQKFTIPGIQVDQSQSAGYQALIRRRPDVIVSVADDAGMNLATPQEAAAVLAELERQEILPPGQSTAQDLLALLEDPQTYRPAVLRIDDNRPEVHVNSVIRIDHLGDRWEATLQAHLDVSKGVLDTLRFDLPDSWTGPFEVQPGIPAEVRTIPGDNRRQLVLRPSAPIDGRLRLELSGPLQMSAGERPHAPLVQLTGATSRTQYFLLPRQLGEQQLAWDTRGLVQKPLPTDLSTIDTAAYRSYQAVAEQSRATLRSVERSRAEPRIRLADISLAWQLDGSCAGTAALEILPAGATSCLLVLPESYQLAHVQLDGSRALCKRLTENRWEIQLGDSPLPRRLEAIWTGSLPAPPANAISLAPPVLEGVPVDRTLWTVSAPGGAGSVSLKNDNNISPLHAELIRLGSTAALIEAAAGALLDESRDELARWYGPWRDALLARRLRLDESRPGEPSDELAAEASAEVQRIVQDQARLAERLGTVEANTAAGTPDANASLPGSLQRAPATRTTDLWRLTQSAGRSLVYATMAGPGSLAIHYTGVEQSGRAVRIAVGLLLLAVSGGLIVLKRRGWTAPPAPRPASYLALAAAGLVIWLWTTLSVIGLAFIAAAIFLTWRQTRRGASQISPATSSAVVKTDSHSSGGSSRH